jgi:5-formyltetrahydrofolate cyclo-ligase
VSPSARRDRAADTGAATTPPATTRPATTPPATVAAGPVAEAKVRLRRAVHARRRNRLEADPAAVAAAGVAVRDRLLGTPELAALRPGSTVAAYRELRSEVPAAAIRAALIARGIQVVVPVLLSDGDLDWVAESASPTTAADGPQPALLGPGAIAHAAVVLLPGIAADRTGHRLGRGGGSYDRALARLDALPAADRPWTCLLLFADEVVTDVPVDAHDIAVDAVVTPAGLLRTVRRPGAD